MDKTGPRQFVHLRIPLDMARQIRAMYRDWKFDDGTPAIGAQLTLTLAPDAGAQLVTTPARDSDLKFEDIRREDGSIGDFAPDERVWMTHDHIEFTTTRVVCPWTALLSSLPMMSVGTNSMNL